LRAKVMSLGDQLLAQFDVVVDFAVTDDGNRVVFIEQRLHAAFEVDDSQTGVAKEGAAFEELPTVGSIGATMTQQISSTIGPR